MTFLVISPQIAFAINPSILDANKSFKSTSPKDSSSIQELMDKPMEADNTESKLSFSFDPQVLASPDGAISGFAGNINGKIYGGVLQGRVEANFSDASNDTQAVLNRISFGAGDLELEASYLHNFNNGVKLSSTLNMSEYKYDLNAGSTTSEGSSGIAYAELEASYELKGKINLAASYKYNSLITEENDVIESAIADTEVFKLVATAPFDTLWVTFNLIKPVGDSDPVYSFGIALPITGE